MPRKRALFLGGRGGIGSCFSSGIMFAATLLTLSLLGTPDIVLEGPQTRVQADVGLSSAMGFGGASLLHRTSARTAVELGADYGQTGVRGFFMPHLVFGTESHRVSTGLGLSLATPAGQPFERLRGNVLWLDAELLGYEHLLRSGLSVSVSAGVAVSLSGAEHVDRCGRDCSWSGQQLEDGTLILPSFRAGIGYWF